MFVYLYALLSIAALPHSIKGQVSGPNCQTLSKDLAQKLPGFQKLLDQAKSQWQVKDWFVNWDQHPSVNDGAEICARPDKGKWQIDTLDTTNCQKTTSAQNLTNINNPNVIVGRIGITQGSSFQSSFTDTSGKSFGMSVSLSGTVGIPLVASATTTATTGFNIDTSHSSTSTDTQNGETTTNIDYPVQPGWICQIDLTSETCKFKGSMNYPIIASGKVWFLTCGSPKRRRGLLYRRGGGGGGHKEPECSNTHQSLDFTILTEDERSLKSTMTGQFSTSSKSAGSAYCPVQPEAKKVKQQQQQQQQQQQTQEQNAETNPATNFQPPVIGPPSKDSQIWVSNNIGSKPAGAATSQATLPESVEDTTSESQNEDHVDSEQSQTESTKDDATPADEAVQETSEKETSQPEHREKETSQSEHREKETSNVADNTEKSEVVETAQLNKNHQGSHVEKNEKVDKQQEAVPEHEASEPDAAPSNDQEEPRNDDNSVDNASKKSSDDKKETVKVDNESNDKFADENVPEQSNTSKEQKKSHRIDQSESDANNEPERSIQEKNNSQKENRGESDESQLENADTNIESTDNTVDK